jgi:predicted O-methyltransferase YrrM
MAYHGYIPHIKSFLSKISEPRVLEIGLDKGITTIPLTVFMSRLHKSFEFFGIDVLLQESLLITLSNIDRSQQQKIKLFENNSLELLPKLVASNEKFDVILIDGDHNYHTVINELNYLNDLSKKESLIIIDDYNGRWAEKDLWYAEREGYEKVEDATKRIDTEKRGVKAAVDEFLSKNDEWESSFLMQGEPIVLKKKVENNSRSMFDL